MKLCGGGWNCWYFVMDGFLLIWMVVLFCVLILCGMMEVWYFFVLLIEFMLEWCFSKGFIVKKGEGLCLFWLKCIWISWFEMDFVLWKVYFFLSIVKKFVGVCGKWLRCYGSGVNLFILRVWIWMRLMCVCLIFLI